MKISEAVDGFVSEDEADDYVAEEDVDFFDEEDDDSRPLDDPSRRKRRRRFRGPRHKPDRIPPQEPTA